MQDNDFIYRKDLSPERIRQIQESASALRYTQNCITAAVIGVIIANLTAMLCGVQIGLALILISFFGAVIGYAFYAWGHYLQRRADSLQPPDETNQPDGNNNDDPPADESEKALCPNCLEPIDPFNYYCPKCGEATGRFTPYMPYVNIRFNYSIFGRLWQRLWYEKTGVATKLISATLIIIFVPIMFLGLPFVIYDKLSHRKTNPENKD